MAHQQTKCNRKKLHQEKNICFTIFLRDCFKISLTVLKRFHPKFRFSIKAALHRFSQRSTTVFPKFLKRICLTDQPLTRRPLLAKHKTKWLLFASQLRVL